MTLVMKFNFR